MKKSSKKKTESQIKEIYQEFYGHLASIFWESKLYLFHCYALQNVQSITKQMKNVSGSFRQEMNDKFVLAALSIPLNSKISNFERLAFNYIPDSMKQFDQKTVNAN
jgi:hypothetical protein